MLLSILINYIFGLLIDRYQSNKISKKTLLFIAISCNLLILMYFKYSNFLIDNLNNLFSLSLTHETVKLPIGISFYTFHSISYLVDIYFKKSKVQKNPIDMALYISLFPQLVAGPIVRYNQISHQLRDRTVNLEKFSGGVLLFIAGLTKKVLIANQLGVIADAIFSKAPADLSISLAWLGIICYSLQIYFDFSGYSDMAIGLGKMFGFDFPKNFNYPYISQSISEFWRRWHISLGLWFRDYVYIPLGGNRVSKWKVYRNLFIVWALTGFWHGASWTFIAWGLYYGCFIAIEKAGFGKILEKIWSPIRHLYVTLIFLIGWVFFRADNFSFSVQYLKALFGINGHQLMEKLTVYYLHDNWLIILLGVIFATPILPFINQYVSRIDTNLFFLAAKRLLVSGVSLALFILCIIHLTNSTYNPFIYFRF